MSNLKWKIRYWLKRRLFEIRQPIYTIACKFDKNIYETVYTIDTGMERFLRKNNLPFRRDQKAHIKMMVDCHKKEIPSRFKRHLINRQLIRDYRNMMIQNSIHSIFGNIAHEWYMFWGKEEDEYYEE